MPEHNHDHRDSNHSRHLTVKADKKGQEPHPVREGEFQRDAQTDGQQTNDQPNDTLPEHDHLDADSKEPGGMLSEVR